MKKCYQIFIALVLYPFSSSISHNYSLQIIWARYSENSIKMFNLKNNNQFYNTFKILIQ